MASKKNDNTTTVSSDFESLVDSIVRVHGQAQDYATKAVNVGLTLRNYTMYPQIRETLTPESLPLLQFAPQEKRETLSPKSPYSTTNLLQRLSFSHLVELLELPDEMQRRFYEIECIRGNWSVRELRRQIASLYYERNQAQGWAIQAGTRWYVRLLPKRSGCPNETPYRGLSRVTSAKCQQ